MSMKFNPLTGKLDMVQSKPKPADVVSFDIDFNASTQEDIIIPLDCVREVLIARLYIDQDPGVPFEAWATYTFYNKVTKKGEDAFYRTQAKLVYTELEVATTGSDANIIPDDHTDFNPNDLALILDGLEFIRLQTIANTMIAEDTIGAHPIDAGLVRVSEFSGFSLFNNEGNKEVYLRISFTNPQTVSLKLDLILKK